MPVENHPGHTSACLWLNPSRKLKTLVTPLIGKPPPWRFFGFRYCFLPYLEWIRRPNFYRIFSTLHHLRYDQNHYHSHDQSAFKQGFLQILTVNRSWL